MQAKIRSMLGALVAGSALLATTIAVFAATPNCEAPGIDRTACYREAAAAQAMERQGLPKSTANYQQNALARCQRQPAGDARTACEQRVTGAGNSSVRGSVAGGGKIRTTEMPVTPPPPAPPK